MRNLSPLAVNPIAFVPQLVPSAYGSVYENDDRPALRAAIFVDVFSAGSSLCSHGHGV